MSPASRTAPFVLAFGTALVACALASPAAQAQPSSTGPSTSPSKDDLTTLEKQLSNEVTALTTTDCTSACRALASIRRAADKICALDPGERCASARAKADDASRRVRAACPDCAIANAPGGSPPAPPAPTPEHKPADTPTKGGATRDEVAVAKTDGPPSESKRGGCAGCTTTKATHGDVAGVALVVVALAGMLRRRRR